MDLQPAGPSAEETLRQAEARPRRPTFFLLIVALASVLVPYLFWRGTWFGRTLSDPEMEKYLADQEKPRQIQHALVQIGERIGRGDPAAKRWYPRVIELARSPHEEIRNTLAWVMGADNRSEEFHRALLGLLPDPEPLVRRNAALSLVRFGDASGREEILAMLRPYAVRAPAAGTVRYRLQEGNPVDHGTLLARLETGQGTAEIRSPVPGTLERKLIKDQSGVAAGQEILVLSPASEETWEALRALYLVGRAEDLPEVERYARPGVSGRNEKIPEQAHLTAAEIRRRTLQEQGTQEEKEPGRKAQ